MFIDTEAGMYLPLNFVQELTDLPARVQRLFALIQLLDARAQEKELLLSQATSEAREEIREAQIELSATKVRISHQMLDEIAVLNQHIEQQLVDAEAASRPTPPKLKKKPGCKPKASSLCVCQKRRRELMIECENTYCPRKWFHVSCMGITDLPSGCWYCPFCQQGASPPVPAQQEAARGPAGLNYK